MKPTAASFHRVVDGDHAQGPEYPSCVSWFQNNFNVEIEKQKLQGDRTACQIDSTEKNRAKVAHLGEKTRTRGARWNLHSVQYSTNVVF